MGIQSHHAVERTSTATFLPDEPLLAVDNIQGHILVPFGTSEELHLFCRVTSARALRAWLRALLPMVTSMATVLDVRRRRRAGDASLPVLLHVALGFEALRLLDPVAQQFDDESFRVGMSARSIDVLKDAADPQERTAPVEGNRRSWRVGGPHNPADVLLILAADRHEDLRAAQQRIEQSMRDVLSALPGTSHPAAAELQIVFAQPASLLPGEPRCREHFGYRDAISQPGVRGRLSRDPNDDLTPRHDGATPHQGRPGEDLIWPGEFVFGYPRQDRFAETVEQPGPDSLDEARRVRLKDPVKRPAAPSWARDGSFLVVRRLRQYVDHFEAFLEENARTLGVDKEWLAAKLMGRWRSGAPLLRTDGCDDATLAVDDIANNDFAFGVASTLRAPKLGGDYPVSTGDPAGVVCPFAAHIRKTFPRDDVGTASSTILSKDGEPYLPGDFRDVPPIGLVRTQTHRILRRGIPFGPAYAADCAGVERGLMFVCFQTSIQDQFEFVTRWMNSPDFKDKTLDDGTLQTGHDLIAGQAGGSRERQFRLALKRPDGSPYDVILRTADEWVVPTGGGYFFSPSIDALRNFAAS
jgi:Dyp-type peroxidase family